MFPGNAEFVARERHKDLLHEANQRRLIKTIEAGQANRSTRLQRVVGWVGLQLVTWGLKLQGQPLAQSTQLANPTSMRKTCRPLGSSR